jgi:hypothetical protein
MINYSTIRVIFTLLYTPVIEAWVVLV